ncbi:MAG: hypothetical protein IPO39_04985 [Bacteroidetes bacterium]|nr:hypothetical protein [Bacteroidota bacterium]
MKSRTKTLLVLSIFAVFFGTITLALQQKQKQKPVNSTPSTESYKQSWERVDELTEKGLSKSALEVVQTIYQKAKQEHNSAELVKAVIHRMKFQSYTEENDIVKITEGLKEEIKGAVFPERPLLHSMLAEVYWSYYQRNRYRILNRTETVNFKNDDIQTWTNAQFVDAVLNEYTNSLKDAAAARKTKINVFDLVLDTGNTDGRKFRPTLYDFLAHRALAFYMNSESGLTRPADNFELNSAFYLNTADMFLNFILTSKDTSDFKFKAIVLLQDLIAFHRDDSHPGAFIDVDLMRLKFVHQELTIPTKDSLYNIALAAIAEQYKEYPGCTEALYEQAELSYNEGGKYTENREQKYKWKIRNAEKFCDEAISRFPYSDGGINCKALKRQINLTSFSLLTEQVNIPQQIFRAKVDYKNIQTLFLRIVKDDQDPLSEMEGSESQEKIVGRLLKLSPIKEWKIELPEDSDKQNHATEISLPGLSVGQYSVIVSSSPDFKISENRITYAHFRISNIGVVHRSLEDGGSEIYVLNRESGAAMEKVDARVIVREYNYNARKYFTKLVETFTSDAEGRIEIPMRGESYRNFNIEFVKGEDHLFLREGFYQYAHARYPNNKQERTFFFTDRAIYRPGQTIYFKGIILQGTDEDAELIRGKSTTVTFYDVNGQKISDQTFITSEYGTFHGSFVAPQGVLTGPMRIQNKSGSAYFRVEEYKRPKFEVTFDPVKSSYRLGETVSVTGKAAAFSGQSIDGAKVQYRVVRMVRYPIWCFWKPYYYSRGAEQEILNGTSETNAKGEFTVTFSLLPDQSIPKENEPIFNYRITTDVSDINGETRNGETILNAAYTSLELSSDLGQELNFQKKNSFTVFSKNLSGQHTPAEIHLTIHELKSPDRILRERLWPESDKHVIIEKDYIQSFPFDVYSNEDDESKWEKKRLVVSADLNTAKDSIFTLKKSDLTAGKYMLEGTAKDQYGQNVRLEQSFTVIDPEASTPPLKMLDWFTVLKDNAMPGGVDQILIGSSDKDVRVLYEIELKGKIISKQWLELNRSQQLISIPVKEEYRGNFSVYFTFIRRGRSFTHSAVLNVPWDNKELSYKYESFRSKLTPGQKEEWRIRITGKQGDKVSAEMLASMYDASLDAFAPHNWNFSIYNLRGNSIPFRSGSFGTIGSNWYSALDIEEVQPFEFRNYDYLNWFGFPMANFNLRGSRADATSYYVDGIKARGNIGLPAAASEVNEQLSLSSGAVMTKETVALQVNDSNASTQNQEQQQGSKTNASVPPSVRRNLSETAFFYPQLLTNDSGEVVISFSSPEALTKWKFMSFAHTKDLRFALDEKEIVTQKQVMVIPNAPRFLREGDKIVFPAKISCMSDTPLTGSAKLQLFDAITMQPIDADFGNNLQEKKFSLRKGESAPISWSLIVPEGQSAIVYRVTAIAGEYSDGEEQALPVLSNKQLVTEALPLWQRGNDSKTFELSKLVNNTSPSLRNVKLTLEYTSNPAWSAIQALPYLMEYPYQCSEQIFSRYYANSIASHIANSSPRIKAVFDSWKSSSPDAFLSNLEKNQELKSLLLEETPWVMQAKDESERKKRVGLLFDLNKMSQELNTALNQLQKAQSSNGGWPWFEGMPESRYITQHIVTGMGHLDHLGIKTIRDDAKSFGMINKAIQYLDIRITEDYNNLKKSKTDLDKYHPSGEQIQYLYARSYFPDIQLSKNAAEAHAYYMKRVKEFWLNAGEYLQGMIALTCYRSKDPELALGILKSLKENSQNKEETGMYWANNTGGYFWSRASIETQALLIEAFDEITDDKKAVEDMRVWLLRQKQTQDWKTTKATTEACYALLLRGSDWLSQAPQMDIRVGKEKVEIPTDAQAGTGYFKTSWSGKEITRDMGKVSVQKISSSGNNNETVSGISWGGLYWQYFESLDKITPHVTPLNLKKELFVERTSARGPVIEPLNSSTTLKVGDRIKVRIELRVDRDMEYVHMKDMRASGLEPENVLSQYKWQDGLGYYESTRDASTNFFFSYLRKGVYVFEYPLRAFQEGEFSNGITSIECMYAPEFSAHSLGERIVILGK